MKNLSTKRNSAQQFMVTSWRICGIRQRNIRSIFQRKITLVYEKQLRQTERRNDDDDRRMIGTTDLASCIHRYRE